VAPANALQDTIAAIWEELLAVLPVGIRDGFLELGGDSLLAVRMIERVGERLGRRISLEVLATSSTVEELSLRPARFRARDLSAPLVPLQVEGPLPPSTSCTATTGATGCTACRCPAPRPRQAGVPPSAGGLDGPKSRQHRGNGRAASEPDCGIPAAGPYLLGGNCNGGLVAFEMARRLVAAGERVDMLVVIRANAGMTTLRLPRRLVRMLGAGLGMNGAREGAAWSETRRLLKRWEQLPPGERNRRLLAKVRRAGRAAGPSQRKRCGDDREGRARRSA
jgi:acyl carrier protein